MTTRDGDWQIRLYVYETLIATGEAPTLERIAERLSIDANEARQALRRLQEAHALVLSPGSVEVMMAHPFSAAPTEYRVTVTEQTHYANCAWDSLGIPAALKRDAQMVARHPLGGRAMHYHSAGGRLQSNGNYLVHFAHPFRQWYDDIVET